MTVATDGSISVLCQPRGTSRAPFTATSTDGAHFVAGAPVPGQHIGGVLGATSATDLFVLLDRLYRSTDSGAHWTPVTAGPSGGSYIGFESATVGRVISGAQSGGDGTWTTTDGGQSWTFHSFG